MSKLKQIAFEDESEEIKDRVRSYWAKRAGSFSEHKHAEMHSEKMALWQEEFRSKLGEEPHRILDIGCGAGFFEAVLSPMGHQVTGIDLTPEMIERGQDLMKRHHFSADLYIMDAENPDFPAESFDVIVSRNLVWTLPHPAEAYQRWYQLLAPGGTLLVYDAEYAKGFHRFDQSKNCAHLGVDDELKEECHRIYHMLSISSLDRPAWDEQILRGIGFSEVSVDTSVGDRIYASEDAFYMPDRMFGIKAVK